MSPPHEQGAPPQRTLFRRRAPPAGPPLAASGPHRLRLCPAQPAPAPRRAGALPEPCRARSLQLLHLLHRLGRRDLSARPARSTLSGERSTLLARERGLATPWTLVTCRGPGRTSRVTGVGKPRARRRPPRQGAN